MLRKDLTRSPAHHSARLYASEQCPSGPWVRLRKGVSKKVKTRFKKLTWLATKEAYVTILLAEFRRLDFVLRV